MLQKYEWSIILFFEKKVNREDSEEYARKIIHLKSNY